jgi:ABC-type sulfate transport system substrate-binding protein
MKNFKSILLAALVITAIGGGLGAKDYELFNVSYDPTRELYREFNASFARHWKEKHPGDNVKFKQSHGGSGKPARAVMDGLDADVVTLALAGDINIIVDKAKLLPGDWQKRRPNNSAPYTSTIVFVVRKGNPKGIKDWAVIDTGARGSTTTFTQRKIGDVYISSENESFLTGNAEIARAYLVTIDGALGGWKNARKTHFDDSGVFDQIYK